MQTLKFTRRSRGVRIMIEVEKARLNDRLMYVSLTPGSPATALAYPHLASKTSGGKTTWGVMLMTAAQRMVGWIISPEHLRDGKLATVDSAEEARARYAASTPT